MTASDGRSIYHITHVDNLTAQVANGGLFCDRAVSAAGGPAVSIGMAELKGRRFGIPVPMHLPLTVADFVPFYFCPRTVMLFVIKCANNSDLTYTGGQGSIVHLRFDLPAVLEWANANGVSWAFTLQNATAAYADFRNTEAELGEVGWDAVNARSWSASHTKDAKQAEFLVENSIPFSLLAEIGVSDLVTLDRVQDTFGGSSFRPRLNVRPDWYY